MTDAALLLIYLASTVSCGVLAYYVVEERYAKAKSLPFDVSFVVGIAGFSVFPIINTAIAVGLGFYTLHWVRQNP
jgi:uncharacterized SAM-binding protein YcdF (DUF218 family)